MEIELNTQDYKVKSSRFIPSFLQRIERIIQQYGDWYAILFFCLVGYLGIGLFLGGTGSILWGALVTNNTHFDAFRFVTSIFLHANFIHILLSLLSLYAMVRQLRPIWSHAQIFLIFFISGLLGNYLGYGLYNLLKLSIIAVGASGGLFGLLGAFVAFLLFHKGFSSLQRSFYLRQVLPILILNLLLGFFVPNIALMIHVFGFCVGIFLGWLLQAFPYNFVHNRPYIWATLFFFSFIYIIFCFVVATYNFFKLIPTLPSW